LIGKGGGGGVGVGYGHAALSGPEGGTYALPLRASGSFGFVSVRDDSRSTFSIDVDTASYSSMRRSLLQDWSMPEPASVRIEELVNYFDYDYPTPSGDAPFSVSAEVGTCPWNPDHELIHIGLQGQVLAPEEIPPRNLVFLVDVSGSMNGDDKLPLVQSSLLGLSHTLRAEDRISVVTYAGRAGVVLRPTSGAKQSRIIGALSRLRGGGGTNGSAGIEQAYALAREAFIDEGVNRVILATDGDFNVGVSSHDALLQLIEAKRESGVELSVLGYGMGHRDHTMEQLADKGNGNYAYIDGEAEAHKVLVEEAGATLVTIAKDVKIQVEFDESRVESYRLVGYENRRLEHRDFADDDKDAGEIGAGHTVTALYEVVPKADAPEGAPWMTLNLRYKRPKGERSSRLSLPVVAKSRELEATSNDFRFSAAVASFGMLLRESGASSELSWANIRELARGALGEDPSCRRHQFLELIGAAATLEGSTDLEALSVTCTVAGDRGVEPQTDLLAPEPSPSVVETHEDQPPVRYGTESPVGNPPEGRWAMVLEVLRLLPPLLAFPLFIMAFRRPRRRVRTHSSTTHG